MELDSKQFAKHLENGSAELHVANGIIQIIDYENNYRKSVTVADAAKALKIESKN